MKTMAIMLILAGVVLVVVGLLFLLAGKVPWLGHLPGDINYRGKNTNFSFPLTTCIIVSIILTVILNIVFRMMRK
jgi:uncharacterized protein HemY